MKIAIVMGNHVKHGFPPLGVLYLAGYLRKYQTQCEIDVFDQFPEVGSLLSRGYDLIGFSCMSIQYPDVCEYAMKIRKTYNGIMLIGGVHVTLTKQIPEWADMGIIGEGEETFSELVSSLCGKSYLKPEKIPGMIVRNKENEVIIAPPRAMIANLDTIPFPAWDMVDMDYYLKPNNVYGTTIGRGVSMMTSRGCIYSCQYCAASKMWNTVRFHSAEYVVEMIKYLIDKYNIQHIWLADDHFALKKERLNQIATLLEKYNINIGMGISSRVEAYDDEMAHLLHRLGVKALALGLETGSDRVLKRIKNGSHLTIKEEELIINKMHKDGFEIHGMFMLNTPGETMEDLKKTVDFIYRLPLCKVSTAISVPYFGTEWWDIAVQQGIVDSDPNDFKQLRAYNMKTLERDRPLFRTEIPLSVLEETYKELNDYSKSLFYFDWKNR